jgi:hypothetical protein
MLPSLHPLFPDKVTSMTNKLNTKYSSFHTCETKRQLHLAHNSCKLKKVFGPFPSRLFPSTRVIENTNANFYIQTIMKNRRLIFHHVRSTTSPMPMNPNLRTRCYTYSYLAKVSFAFSSVANRRPH